MPVWLKIAGTLVSMMLSYYTRYNDTAVKDMLKDIAYNQNFALQLLGEISSQLDNVLIEILKVPELVSRISYIDKLDILNTSVHAALRRFEDLADAEINDHIRGELRATYDDLVEARTGLQARSERGDKSFAALAALTSPLSMLLEIAILYKIGHDADEHRKAVIKAYHNWFENMLDGSIPNSLVSSIRDGLVELEGSDTSIRRGLFGPAANLPGTRQALYALEHQINRTVFTTETFPYIRLCVIATLRKEEVFRGDPSWEISNNSPIIEVYDFTRVGHGALGPDAPETPEEISSSSWYGPPPPWTPIMEFFDSGDLRRFNDQTHPERVADIKNSVVWRNLIRTRIPDAVKQLADNNILRSSSHFARDVESSILRAQLVNRQIQEGAVSISASAS